MGNSEENVNRQGGKYSKSDPSGTALSEVQTAKRKLPWLSMKYAQKLKKLHAWNGWLVLLLTITGILLFLPLFRLTFPQTRVWTKELHIYLGLLSLLPLIMYIPMIVKHMKQISRRPGQKWNLRIVLVILVAWAISGLILWQFRQFPPRVNNAALLVHDLASWIGIPYIVFHSLTRMRWVKRADFKPSIERVGVTGAGEAMGISSDNNSKALSQSETGDQGESIAVAVANTTVTSEDRLDVSADRTVITAPMSMQQRLREEAKSNRPKVARRIFIQWVLALFLIVSVGPSFYRWIKRSFDTGGSALDDLIASPDTPLDPNIPTIESQMIPPPTPLPDSNPPIGGGARGRFRIYTVTEMPDSRAETWSFEISGMVDQPITYNWDAFMKLKREVQVSDFHCVTGWSVYDCTWEGIKLSDLMDLSGVKSTAKHVKFYSGDGVYTDTLTLKQARLEDVMVVCLLDGKPIPKKLGGPVRLIVPQMYTYKAVKWLQGIELTDEEEDGYWIVRGYAKDAWVSRGVADNL